MPGDRRSTGAARLGLLAVILALCPARLAAQGFPRPPGVPPGADGLPGPPSPLPPGLPRGAGLKGPADPPVPMVAVRVRVPAEALPGKELTYRIAVVNRS